MANFALLGLDNVILETAYIDTINSMTPEGVEQEDVGVAYLQKVHGTHLWVKTSFNTRGGVHLNGGTPFRKNYAEIGGHYDSTRDAFIGPKPYDSWILDETTCLWGPPSDPPDDGKEYDWDEDTTNWVVITE